MRVLKARQAVRPSYALMSLPVLCIATLRLRTLWPQLSTPEQSGFLLRNQQQQCPLKPSCQLLGPFSTRVTIGWAFSRLRDRHVSCEMIHQRGKKFQLLVINRSSKAVWMKRSQFLGARQVIQQGQLRGSTTQQQRQ